MLVQFKRTVLLPDSQSTIVCAVRRRFKHCLKLEEIRVTTYFRFKIPFPLVNWFPGVILFLLLFCRFVFRTLLITSRIVRFTHRRFWLFCRSFNSFFRLFVELPILEFLLEQSLSLGFINLRHFAIVSQVINDHCEYFTVSVNEYFIFDLLQFVRFCKCLS
jgi:hypothetical protein